MERPSYTFCEYFPEGTSVYQWQRLKQRGPEQALRISKALYQKAETQNEELSDDEATQRALFLNRGDLVGRALARPQSLTLEEKYELMHWGPPETLHAAIRSASGGQVSPAAGASRQDPCIVLSVVDMGIPDHRRAGVSFPGNQEARNLVLVREGITDAAYQQISSDAGTVYMTSPRIQRERYARFRAAEMSGDTGLLVQEYEPIGFRRIPFSISLKKPKSDVPLWSTEQEDDDEEESFPTPTPRAVPMVCVWDPEDESPRSPNRDDVDSLGRPAWPRLPGRDSSYPMTPDILFRHDEHKSENWDEEFGWLGQGMVEENAKDLRAVYVYMALTAEEKAGYEASSERLRQEAWDELEQRKRDGKRSYDP
ncbi:hypothetical protein PGQ11_001756 [Apiospora arundinis]|uniref:Uncharacterized protein n=1 Tax=Apiospora arundinis TaxID=335852 RepID=A0ABR2JGA7_9PEZI